MVLLTNKQQVLFVS